MPKTTTTGNPFLEPARVINSLIRKKLQLVDITCPTMLSKLTCQKLNEKEPLFALLPKMNWNIIGRNRITIIINFIMAFRFCYKYNQSVGLYCFTLRHRSSSPLSLPLSLVGASLQRIPVIASILTRFQTLLARVCNPCQLLFYQYNIRQSFFSGTSAMRLKINSNYLPSYLDMEYQSALARGIFIN